ncbi:GNAT family N-acetyltransferase [Zobellia barbeyronii]|uniref:GNAT family N-acetyltransferase n=1 Tax=Zobellia barbeyronii TaxID=2748009 RepID=A0ABS5WHC9_9FLAO|nr:GNAT family N-acetyltransferase [Zobellia barbeyronii]MBT2162575.1 GNAT family N-acetyltransferase [Zobellia barbeyronii]
MIAYRSAVLADAMAIAQLHAKSWQENYRGAFSDVYLDDLALSERQQVWHKRLENPISEQRVVVADSNGIIVGFACIFISDHAVYGTLLDNLHVSKDVQGMGVGRHLMSLVAKEVLKNPSSLGMYLWVLENNKAAQGFYDSCGGERLETVEGTDIGDKPILKVRYYWSSMEKLIRTNK